MVSGTSIQMITVQVQHLKSQEIMSDRHRDYLEKWDSLEQVYLKKCFQKAQTEKNVSHAKEIRMVVVQGSKTQVCELCNTADCDCFFTLKQ